MASAAWESQVQYFQEQWERNNIVNAELQKTTEELSRLVDEICKKYNCKPASEHKSSKDTNETEQEDDRNFQNESRSVHSNSENISKSPTVQNQVQNPDFVHHKLSETKSEVAVECSEIETFDNKCEYTDTIHQKHKRSPRIPKTGLMDQNTFVQTNMTPENHGVNKSTEGSSKFKVHQQVRMLNQRKCRNNQNICSNDRTYVVLFYRKGPAGKR